MPNPDSSGNVCPHCGHDADKSCLGNIGDLLIFDCDGCGKRFFGESLRNHNCNNVLARQKRQWHERKVPA